MEYRSDIQFLRGLSVLLVVLYHLDIGFAASGFLGVDVFFVISGFLMSVLYDANDIKGFFIRRMKRLLPAYFVLIGVTLGLCAVLLTPYEFSQSLSQSAFGIFFISNIGYWLDSSYFSSSDFNPLLHLWSLGVEIQFYLFVPIIFLLFSRSKVLTAFVFAASLILCLVFLYISPKTSFFMLPFRVWEFVLGYFVAAKLTNNGNVIYSRFSLFGFFGLAILFLIPTLNVDGRVQNIFHGHPGLNALLVCCATAFVLALGLPKFFKGNAAYLSFVKLGKYSYSIYLVHFPIIALYFYQPFSGTILKPDTFFDSMILVAMISVASYSMYHLVETKLGKAINFKVSSILLPTSIILIVGLSLGIQNLRFTQQEKLIFDALTDRSEFRCGKLLTIMNVLNSNVRSCDLTPEVTTPEERILLVGNSHSDTIKATFSSVAASHNAKVYFIIPNNPLMKNGMSASEVMAEATKKRATSIVLHFSANSINPVNIEQLMDLAKVKHISVSLIMPVPTWNESVPKMLYKHVSSNGELQEQTLYDYKSSNEKITAEITRLSHDGLQVYNVANSLCENKCLLESPSGHPLYFDSNHLTITGSQYLRSVFESMLIGVKLAEN